jgi:hypothetical protein
MDLPYGVEIVQCDFDRKPEHEELEKNNCKEPDKCQVHFTYFANVDSGRWDDASKHHRVSGRERR